MEFIDKLNAATENKYDFLRISKLNLDVGSKSLSLVFLLPQNIDEDKFGIEDKKTVEDFCRAQVPETFSLKIVFTVNYINTEAVARQVLNFISAKYSTIMSQMDNSLTEVKIREGKITIDLFVYSTVEFFCKNSGFADKLSKFIYNQNCIDKVVVNINVCKRIDAKEVLEERQDVKYVDTGEIDIIGNYHYMIGKDIIKKPRYIEKYKKELDGVCVCGSVKDLKRINIIDKTSPDRKIKKVLFKFVISDTTGSMDCLYFAKIRKPKKGEKESSTCLDMLKDGDDVIIFGNYRHSDFSDKNELMIVKLALCKINYEGLEKRRDDIKKANKIKIFASPKKYEADMSESLLDIMGHCDYIMNNDFIVFDLETTGLSIYDEDVKNSPYIEDVFEFFINYCKGYKLIAHNGMGFDFKVIRRESDRLGIPFTNELIDSLTEARNILPHNRRHSLEALCNHYGIINRQAHRAYEDAEATAKVFVKLMDDKCRKDVE